MAVASLALTAPAVSAQTHAARPSAEHVASTSTDLRGVFTGSLRLLVMEHSARIAVQRKTRRELGGPFWADYGRSIRTPRQWGDGDGWLVNYVGHPGHGAAAGFIWAHHDPSAPSEDSVFDKAYWRSRLRASAWSAAYSLQFELGPLSEASIGNVGRNPATTGWVDHVVTPLGGLAVMAAEDALDRYVVRRIESRLKNPIVRGLVRTSLNPARAMANVASGRAAWHRESRPLSGT
jgi:hypothetical protein